tara:strand:+ start:23 stop:235 length:213 start_codon:yes stop_codon:yes gene_type:complete
MTKGRAWAYLVGEWRQYTSELKSSEELIDSLRGKGYLAAEYNKGTKPAYPTRRQVLAARGIHEEEIDYND